MISHQSHNVACWILTALWLIFEVSCLMSIRDTQWWKGGRAYANSVSGHAIWVVGFAPFYTVIPIIVIWAA
jgi:hypothetical protein